MREKIKTYIRKMHITYFKWVFATDICRVVSCARTSTIIHPGFVRTFIVCDRYAKRICTMWDTRTHTYKQSENDVTIEETDRCIWLMVSRIYIYICIVLFPNDVEIATTTAEWESGFMVCCVIVCVFHPWWLALCGLYFSHI